MSAVSAAFDPGPSKTLARHFAKLPEHPPEKRELFWYDWGPIFYRGRLNGSARLLGIASDPGPTERVACRTLVGDAGQRVQGFLAKLGLTRSYALVNAHAYALHPGKASKAKPLLGNQDQLDWRNELYDRITGPKLEAIVAFGGQAHEALRLWNPRPDLPTFEIEHPSSHTPATLQNEWRAAITDLREIITPDPDGDPQLPNYGTEFRETDYAPIPARDLPFGLPAWFGDDAWGRNDSPRHNNCVGRPASDPDHGLIWQAPKTHP